METAIRFSQNSVPGLTDQRFLKVDVTGKAFRLCQITRATPRNVQYKILHSSAKVPAFRAFDWHPENECLVAVGQPGGEATLVNIEEGFQDSVTFSVRSQRLCNAVALSSQNLLAVGLDRVRTDVCLNIWDINQKLPASNPKTFTKTYTEPLHKLAGGEVISSLKFFNDAPQLLVAGVKGQFVRLYDLREPASSNVLQFATRCVHNLAIDHQDSNYFASCFPSTEPLVSVWDRRMTGRANSMQSFYSSTNNTDRQNESSLELSNPADPGEAIWSLRFSKSRRGCLGMLSSAGHLKVYEIGKEFVAYESQSDTNPIHESSTQQPQEVYLENIEDIERAYKHPSSSKSEKQRIVSFDFMTGVAEMLQPRLIVLTGEDAIRVTSLRPAPSPICFSPSSSIYKGSRHCASSKTVADAPSVGKTVDHIRRIAQPRNYLRHSVKQAKNHKDNHHTAPNERRRMSSYANFCWNADLGFFERYVPLEHLLTLLSIARYRCQAGYLLVPGKNRTIASDSQWHEAFWSWIDRMGRISKNGQMSYDNVDLSYIGIFNIWMEEIPVKPRLSGTTHSSISSLVKGLVNRLDLPARRGSPTEYPWHRKLCLHISGSGGSIEELENKVQALINKNQHTKAAALAFFADEEKLAYKALRAKTATQTHRMIAMAIAGARSRARGDSRATGNKEDSDEETDSDWMESITSFAYDLADPYARAILAYVRSGSWEDVVAETALPLKDRIGVALRHLSDADLTEFIGRTTREVITNGDIEGVILTGTGTREGLELLQNSARVFGDLQTSVLGLFAGGAASRIVLPDISNNSGDRALVRKLDALRETYRATIMSWGLKYDRVRFDIACSRAVPTNTSASHLSILPKPKEQIRLVCGHCSQSLTQFEANNYTQNRPVTSHTGYRSPASNGPKPIDTAKTSLTSEKAAVQGTVCPKCGRHLPRCGVCDLWLGTPNETYAKWSSTVQKSSAKGPAGRSASSSIGTHTNNNNHNSNAPAQDLSASISTTIGPPTSSDAAAAYKRSPLNPIPIPQPQPQSDHLGNDHDSKWASAMSSLIIWCVKCSHGFHALHARMWFDGVGDGDGDDVEDEEGAGGGVGENWTVDRDKSRNGTRGHRVCPVPECGCACNGQV